MNNTTIQKLLEEFNSPDTILVISKYPYKDIAPSFHGVAKYTQNTLRAVQEYCGQRFVVLVQKEYSRDIEIDGNGNILILPVFGEKTPQMFLELLRTVDQFDRISTVHIHSEFFTSGQPVQMALVIPFLAMLKVKQKHISYFAHNVVDDFSFLTTHLGRKQTDTKLKTIERLIPLYYKFLSRTVDQVVVLDQSVKQRMSKFVSSKKITLSPIWIEAQKTTAAKRKYWRQKLGFNDGDFVLLCFGFMTSYKGVDWLVDTVNFLRRSKKFRNTKLILAGGKAPSQTGKAHYERFYNQLAQKVAKSTSMILTGFIPDNELDNYFAAADLVVLPYRGVLGASASWAHVMSYGKPFAVSEDIRSYLESQDVQEALHDHNLRENQLIFKRNRVSFKAMMNHFMNQSLIRKASNVSRSISAARSPRARILIEREALYTPQMTGISLQLQRVAELNKSLQALFTE